MHTPYFPALRSVLAPLGRRVQQLRQQSLCHLELLLSPLLPPGLLSQADEGANSRDRVYSLRRTFFGSPTTMPQSIGDRRDRHSLSPTFNHTGGR